MNRFTKIIILSCLLFWVNLIVFGQEIELNKKVFIEDSDDLRPLKPYINDCCYKVELDLVPSTDRKSGHLATLLQKGQNQVPKSDEKLRDGTTLKGYDVITTSGQSKMRSNNPELVMTEMIPRISQTQLVAVNNEGRLVEMIPKDTKFFIRNIKTQVEVKVPTTQRINGEAKFGDPLAPEIPRDQKPLYNGFMTKGYDWIAASNYLGLMLFVEDRPFGEIPREPFMSNRAKIEFPVQVVPAWNNSYLDCR